MNCGSLVVSMGSGDLGTVVLELESTLSVSSDKTFVGSNPPSVVGVSRFMRSLSFGVLDSSQVSLLVRSSDLGGMLAYFVGMSTDVLGVVDSG